MPAPQLRQAGSPATRRQERQRTSAISSMPYSEEARFRGCCGPAPEWRGGCQGKGDECIGECNKALEIKAANVKALFRRGKVRTRAETRNKASRRRRPRSRGLLTGGQGRGGGEGAWCCGGGSWVGGRGGAGGVCMKRRVRMRRVERRDVGAGVCGGGQAGGGGQGPAAGEGLGRLCVMGGKVLKCGGLAIHTDAVIQSRVVAACLCLRLY